MCKKLNSVISFFYIPPPHQTDRYLHGRQIVATYFWPSLADVDDDSGNILATSVGRPIFRRYIIHTYVDESAPSNRSATTEASFAQWKGGWSGRVGAA